MQDNYLHYHAGDITSVLFTNEENGYSVVRIHTDEGLDVLCVGTIPFPAAGERLEISGTVIHHAKYGEQFKITSMERKLPVNPEAIEAYLGSGIIKGLGAKTAKLIVERFGAKALEILENEPMLLAELRGISQKKAREMSAEFNKLVNVKHLVEYLTMNGFLPHVAMRLYQEHGNQAMAKLRENPYLVLDEPQDFTRVDALAASLNIDKTAQIRLEAGLFCQLQHNANQGHCYLPRESLVQTAAQLLSLETETVDIALDGMIDEGLLVSETETATVYLPEYYIAEVEVAQRLVDLHNSPPPPTAPWKKRLTSLAKEAGISLAASQKEAVNAAVENALFILTGGPGTGKTTTIRTVVTLFKELGLEVALAAPTGRAAKRMSELCGHEATTIHRLLGIGYDPNYAFHNEDEPLPHDVIVIDEISMVDIRLMLCLVRAVKPDARLILVGDADQLPSVGAGNVLLDILQVGDDIIETGFAKIQLTEIFRQAAESKIIVAAHDINRGVTPEVSNEGDMFFLKRQYDEAALQTLDELCSTRLPEKMGFASDQIQVISPTRKGACGTNNLNKLLQQSLNPPSESKPERRFGETIYRLGDRVIQTRNNYELEWVDGMNETAGKGVFNGDIGTITHIDTLTVTVTFTDYSGSNNGTSFIQKEEDEFAELLELNLVEENSRTIDYPNELLFELDLAYALTVHKAQGSEFPAVLFVCMPAPAPLLNRKVLYTGITRARELLILVGRTEVLEQMVQKKQGNRRYTSLRKRIEELLD